ncbi:MAG: Holliday junction resolvase RuvX [Gammaproteobacteria bacterium]|nr:Holliday junction resolvase RuvX [Gammaproteobacteria bacterium]
MADPSISNNQTILAFDFGLRRLGIAVGQSLTQTAQPLTTLICKNGTPDWHEIEKLQRQWQPNCFVIGLPLNADGSDSTATAAARKFAGHIEQRFSLPVYLFDERYSSVTAEELLKKLRQSGERRRQIRKEDIDKFAAAVILQSWFKEKEMH